MKRCGKCSISHNTRGAYCRECKADYNRQYRKDNTARCKKYSKDYYERNREDILAHLKAKREVNGR